MFRDDCVWKWVNLTVSYVPEVGHFILTPDSKKVSDLTAISVTFFQIAILLIYL